MKKALLSLFFCGISTVTVAQSNYLDSYLGGTITLTTIGSISNQVDRPHDLDFKPNSNELWVCNYGDNNGGSIVIFYNAGKPNQWSEYRKDSHTGHFMIYPSAIAFGDNGEWAGVSEIQNTSSPTSTFMGPALWEGDTSIFARVFQNNWQAGFPLGSHIDMLHQSPYAMGIAHDSLKVYWVMDGHNGNICKYDFVMDHGPGYDDHSAGKIWRYTDVPVTRVPDKPSHMVLDKNSGWLYYIDGGTKQVKRMNTNSGSVTGNLTTPTTAQEMLAGYFKVEGATVETLATLTGQPCGIDYYNDRLIVSDNTSGEILIYNTAGTFTLLGTIATQPGVMGVKIGPDNKIWGVNDVLDIVFRIDIPAPVTDIVLDIINSPAVESHNTNFYSTTKFNICDGNITPEITFSNSGTTTVTSMTINYSIDGGIPVSYNWNGSINPGISAMISLPSSSVSNGSHQMRVTISDVAPAAEDVVSNNTIDGSFRVVDPMVSLPLTEEFNSTTFPPAGWNYVHFNPHNGLTYNAAGGFGQSTGSMKMDNYSGFVNITGQADHMITPTINFSNASSNSWVRFNVAYARYDGVSFDQLKVKASSDCGNTWTEIYFKFGSQLMTAPVTTQPFVPTSSQWRTDSVSLAAYAGVPEMLFMFTAVSDFGNNLYIDDIFIGDLSVSVNEIPNEQVLSVYPSPASDIITISFSSSDNNSALCKIYSTDGKLVRSIEYAGGTKETTISISDLPAGIYSVQVNDMKKNIVKL